MFCWLRVRQYFKKLKSVKEWYCTVVIAFIATVTTLYSKTIYIIITDNTGGNMIMNRYSTRDGFCDHEQM